MGMILLLYGSVCSVVLVVYKNHMDIQARCFSYVQAHLLAVCLAPNGNVMIIIGPDIQSLCKETDRSQRIL
jgi:hypothetical protein